MAIKHPSTHTADNNLTAAEYNEAHTVEANTIVDADIGAHTTTKITSPEAKVVFDGTGGHAHGGGTDGKQIDHGGLGGLADDDHTQYQKESEKAAANGYASLDASTLVPLAQIPATLTGKDADTVDTKHYSDISTEIDSDVSTHAALTTTHGATGAVVGTTNTQTLSSKTLTAPKMDVIAEETATAGVTVDGLLIKDSGIAASGITSGTVAHERGGVEADISAVALGGLIVGTGTGTMGLKAVGTNDQVLTADSAVAGGVKWAAGGGSDPLDIVNLVDDFINEGAEAGEYGELGWGVVTGQVDAVAGVAGHPGILRRTSTETTTRTSTYLGSAWNDQRGLTYASVFDVTYIIQLPSIADVLFDAGLSETVGSATPNTCVRFVFDPATSANWYCLHRTGGTQRDNVDSAVAVTTGWTKLRIRRSGATIIFSINGVDVATVNDGASPVAFGPGIMIARTTAASKSVDVDYFHLKITGVGR